MKQAIIDIGSNSMRLTVYEIKENTFKILFKEKIMAGLAGYVEQGALSVSGIECAASGLRTFKEILSLLEIENIAVFATASLRNISNTEDALFILEKTSGYNIEVISGEEEALYGYVGAMQELGLDKGAFIDIGGASTEVAVFEDKQLLSAASFPLGALNLYKDCVKKIMPGENSIKKLQKTIAERIDTKKVASFGKQEKLVGVGGTARAILKIAQKYYQLPCQSQNVTADELNELCELLIKGDKKAIDLVLKLEPDRIHTIVPGALTLQYICRLLSIEELIVSKYGVREGYLCQKILHR